MVPVYNSARTYFQTAVWKNKVILTCCVAFSKGGVKGEGIGECSCFLARRFAARNHSLHYRSRPPLASLVSAFRLPTLRKRGYL